MNEQVDDKIYQLDGRDVKPSIHKHDITSEIKSRAYDLAFESLERFSVERDMSEFIKTKFDEEFLPSWQCVVGRDFAVSLSHESEDFIFFSVENTYFLLFKV